MVSKWSRSSEVALLFGLLLAAPPALAQARPAWVDPPVDLSGLQEPPPATGPEEARPEPAARTAQTSRQIASDGAYRTDRVRAARELAIRYLDVWSAPNRIALNSASAFYGSSVVVHGQSRSFASVLAEKRRFAERWPERSYRYRPTTMRVACASRMPHCTVRSLFDFSASNPRRGRRALGTGEHELVVSFAGSRPAIAIENSRVLQRGAVMRR
jgi:hypothetical protein